jgi:hypothetical protein
MNESLTPGQEELEQQLTRGAYCLHTAITRQAERLNESKAFWDGLIGSWLECRWGR